jgi:nitroimidazol reductase NimA-like FMN-containing flavoprotein (pyridoxamine 5'-phosphate oxidase superfamily)
VDPRSEPPTERTRVRRLPERGAYDRETIHAILDAAPICHLGWVTDEGTPRVVPTIHARVGDTLYLHGSAASRTLRAIADGREVCIVATLLDGLVLARSAFHHSMNYRSVVVYGRPRVVTDRQEQLEACRAIVRHVLPGREDDARMPTERELEQTAIVAIPLEEASAKIRTGPPKDDPEDLELPIWAGVLPLHVAPGEPDPAPDLRPGIVPPDYLGRGRPV